MTKYIKTIFAALIFLTGIAANAQFTTLTFSKPDRTTTTKSPPAKPKEDKVSEKQRIQFFKLRSPTKKQLKQEIDSLKSVLYQKPKAETTPFKIDAKRIEDSVISIFKQYRSALLNAGEKPSSLPKSLPGGSRLSMPLKNAFAVTSGFGIRRHPIFGTVKAHNGIDIRASYENVYAVMDGVVTEAGWDGKGGGNYLKILHHNRFETAYLHLSEAYYRVGEKVGAGFIIAKSGNTGNSTGPHLHFSVKEFGKYIDPLNFLNDLTLTKQLLAQHYGKKDLTN